MTQEKLFNDTKSGAMFSTCRQFRYALWRIWDENKPRVMFIGLNPSKANETQNDNTIKRVIKLANNWGYGGVYMCNCFAFVSTDPAGLNPLAYDPINDKCIKELSEKVSTVVFAWGNFKVVRDKGRDVDLAKMFPQAIALKINKNGSPQHPLFVPGNIQPVPYLPCATAVKNTRQYIPATSDDCGYQKKNTEKKQ
jgi:hypothetical protein